VAADWSALTSYLASRSQDRIVLTWAELAAIVGEIPASAVNHAAWWGGDRPHTRAWRAAGFEVESKRPGESVTLRRTSNAPRQSSEPEPHPAVLPTVRSAASGQPDLLLVSCVKTKRSTPAAAKDLYTSPLFVKERAYAEDIGVPWFILSAQWGLVAPDDWLSPYELRLDDVPSAYRAAWGSWVAARLAKEAGDLTGKTIEIHAGQVYLEPLSPSLRRLGARLTTPLAGLTHGQRLAWYDARRSAGPRAGGWTSPSEQIWTRIASW
jgi:hypothetical protein